MLIKEQALQHWINNFYGYGSWDARYWFIGYEETGGETAEEVADKLNYFQDAHPQGSGELCDIRDLYKHLAVRWDGPKANSYNNMHEYRFGDKAVQHGIWKNLVAFIHGYQQTKPPDILAYQRDHFLSPSDRNEALIQLYPLPGPNSHAWYYGWLDLPQLGFLKTRASYEAYVYQQRMHTILSNISTHKPETVLMFGMENINTIKKSVEEFFESVKFKMVKAEKQKIPQYHQADLNGTILVATTQFPALRHNRIETGFDWEEFGKRISRDV